MQGSTFCELCGVEFHYKSKLERHLRSANHKEFMEFLRSTSTPEPMEIDTGTSFNISSEDHDAYEGTVSGDSDHDDGSECDFVNSFEDDDSAEDIAEESDSFYPFPSKLFALFYLLMNGPRSIGEANTKFVWFMMKCVGVSNVPSFSKVKNFHLPGYVPPTKFLSSSGIPFYVNNLTTIFERCIGNPVISKKLHRYPVLSEEAVSEMYHGTRWHEDRRLRTVMVEVNGCHIYIGDFVEYIHPKCGSQNGKVMRFFEKKVGGITEVYCLVQLMISYSTLQSFNDNDNPLTGLNEESVVVDEDMMSIPLEWILRSCDVPKHLVYYGSDDEFHSFTSEMYEEFTTCKESEEIRKIAQGKPVVTLPYIVYSDDTSGNKTKKWNKFDVCCVKIAGLSRKENDQLHNIHFVCCSNNLNMLEMTSPIATEMILLENEGMVAHDAFLEKDVLLLPRPICFICDNPRAAEICGHLGSSAKMYCRKCHVEREHGISVGEQRTRDQTLTSIAEIRAARTKTKKEELRRKYGAKEVENHFLKIPLDLNSSSPVEVLHCILLGPLKYLLKDFISSLNGEQKKEVLARIKSIGSSGIEGKVYGNICYYFKSFVGRDFKAWAQIAPMVAGPYLSEDKKNTWIALSKVFHISYSNFYRVEDLSNFRECIKNCVELLHKNYPSLKEKLKIHLLLHLVEDMDSFGPAVSFCTERCESFNSTLRMHNVYSNRRAPSRDIAKSYAVIDYLRYLCAGGKMTNGHRCGNDLMKIYNSPDVQQYLNGVSPHVIYESKRIYQHGTLRKLLSAKKEKLKNVSLEVLGSSSKYTLSHMLSNGFNLTGSGLGIGDTIHVYGAVNISGKETKLIGCGSFVSFHGDQVGFLMACIGQDTMRGFCLLQPLEYTGTYTGYDCPLLKASKKILVIQASDITTDTSVLHYCTEKCVFTERMEESCIEREKIQTSNLILNHDFTNKTYYVNVYALSCKW